MKLFQLKKRRVAALLLSLLLACTCSACGGDESSVGKTGADSVSDSAADNAENKENNAPDADNGSADNTPASDDNSGNGDISGDNGGSDDNADANNTGDNNDAGSGNASSGGSSSGSASSGGSSSGNASSGGSSSGNASSGSSSSGGASSGNTSSGGTSSGGSSSGTISSPGDDADLDDGDEEKPMKYIYLSDSGIKYDGDGIAVSGNKVTISKGGHYEISGTLTNGQIYIETDKKKVKLFLNDCSITNKAGSAIFCQRAKKLTISSLSGTTSTISDGGTHDADKGAIFSEDTVVLKGEGTININGVYAHGVQSDDDIKVNGGTVNINSTKSALHSNDGIEINGGTLLCNGGTNGIKTDGYITITGGSSVFIGGVREEKGAIYCDGSFTVTGGTFWAIGNTMTSPDAATTTANIIGLSFANSQSANKVVSVKSGSSTVFTVTSPNAYKTVAYCSPNLLSNATYSVTYGGSVSGGTTKNYVTTGGTVTGTDGGSFTASSKVFFQTVS